MKIIITGATGLIGTSIIKKLTTRGDQVTILTRGTDAKGQLLNVNYVTWTPGKEGDWEKVVDGQDGVIHLAGASIFGRRWNKDYKRKILESRKYGTRSIVDAIRKANNKPPVLVTASGVGYYGKDTGERVITEADSVGNDFLAEVCRLWEEEAIKVEAYDVRRVSIRTGVVLDKNEGALNRMLLPFRLFVGGPLGSGEQWFSWIHIDDLADIYIKALDDNALKGSINGSSPNPVKMKQFAKTLGKVIHRPSWFRVPVFLMKIVLGEAAEYVIGGQKVIPQKLMNFGYKFKYPDVELALKELL